MFYFMFDKYEKQINNELIQSFVSLARQFDQNNIKNFVTEFQNNYKQYIKGEQHDSPEFVADLLNLLGKQTCRAKYEFHNPNLYEKGSSEASWAKLLKEESSIITDLFYGQLKETISCDCGEVTKYEEFLLLDVPIPQNSKNYKLFRMNRNEHETSEDFTIHFE